MTATSSGYIFDSPSPSLQVSTALDALSPSSFLVYLTTRAFDQNTRDTVEQLSPPAVLSNMVKQDPRYI